MSCSHKEFFRIFFGRDEKFRLPKFFVNGYGNTLLNSILLKGPTGPEWGVELRKSDDEIWFGKGWKDFVDYFSLDEGFLLLFKYKGDSRFKVYKIFGQSTMKKQYPIKRRSSKEANNGEKLRVPKVEEIQVDVSGDIMDDTGHGRKRRGKTPSPSSSPHKRMRTSHRNGMQSLNVQKKKCKSSDHSGSRKYGSKTSSPAKEAGRGRSAARGCRSSEDPKRIPSMATKEKAMASLRTSNLNPFFIVVMQPTYIRRHVVHIPIHFAMTYFKEKKGDIILRGLDGRSWSACYNIYQKTSVAHVTRGWNEFVKDNNLQKGDTCKFEVLEGQELRLRVTILRVAEGADDHLTAGKTSSRPAKEAGKGTSAAKRCRSSEVPKRMPSMTAKRKYHMASLRAGNFKSKNPFFEVAMQPSYIRGPEMHIPSCFSKTYLTEKKGDVILQKDGRRWSVCYYFRNEKGSVAQFSHGWREFVKDNNLQVDDTCKFELLGGHEICFKVAIRRVAENANDHLTAGKFQHVMQDDAAAWGAAEKLLSEGTFRALERACECTFNHPNFKLIIVPGFLHNSQPTIPANFSRKYLKCIGEDVRVKFKDKSWSVRLITCSDRPAKFSSGWLAFALESNLEVGDVCVFEMTKRANIVFEVTVFKG